MSPAVAKNRRHGVPHTVRPKTRAHLKSLLRDSQWVAANVRRDLHALFEQRANLFAGLSDRHVAIVASDLNLEGRRVG
jgi:hypothetical protein